MELQKGFSYFTKNADIAKVTHVYECGLLPVHGVVKVGEEKIRVRWSRDGLKCSIPEHEISHLNSGGNFGCNGVTTYDLDSIYEAQHSIAGVTNGSPVTYYIGTDALEGPGITIQNTPVEVSGNTWRLVPPQPSSNGMVTRVTGEVDGLNIDYNPGNIQ